jgi:ribosomal protein S19
MAHRSVWKVPFISPFFFNKKFINFTAFNTWKRSSGIPLVFVDKRVRVYNGSKSISFIVTKDMVGKKLGEMSITKILGSAVAVSKKLKEKRKRKEKMMAKKKKKK